MRALQFIFRVMMGVVLQPAVQDVMSDVAIYTARQAKTQLIKEIENGVTRWEAKRKSPPTIK